MKLKIFFLLFFTIVIGLVNTKCSTSIDPQTTTTVIDTLESYNHKLWPTKIGNSWIYDRYFIPNTGNFDSSWSYKNFNSFGIDIDTTQFKPSFFQATIIDSLYVILGDTLYPTVVLNTGFKIPYYVGEDGIYNMGIYGEEGDSVFSKGLYLPSNIPLNEPWNGQLSFRQEGRFQVKEVDDRRCLSYSEHINTPAGIFECYVIKTRIREAEDYIGYLEIYEYLAPNIGMVAKVRIFIVPNHYWFLYNIDLLTNFYLN